MIWKVLPGKGAILYALMVSPERERKAFREVSISVHPLGVFKRLGIRLVTHFINELFGIQNAGLTTGRPSL